MSPISTWALLDRYAAVTQSTITLPTYIKARPRIYPAATDFLASVDHGRELEIEGPLELRPATAAG